MNDFSNSGKAFPLEMAPLSLSDWKNDNVIDKALCDLQNSKLY